MKEEVGREEGVGWDEDGEWEEGEGTNGCCFELFLCSERGKRGREGGREGGRGSERGESQ